MRDLHKDGESKGWSSAMLDYLSVIMLGFIDTRSVFVPTSAEYFSLMGGMLHLHGERRQQRVQMCLRFRIRPLRGTT